jgi:formylglycine-generating enzyme required for sulfatase activity
MRMTMRTVLPTALLGALLAGCGGGSSETSAPILGFASSERGPLPGMRFVKIKAGSFMMGSSNEEIAYWQAHPPVEELAFLKVTPADWRTWVAVEGPQHEVRVSTFQLMTTEVTQAQWQALMGDNPSFNKGGDLPVEQVSWQDVQGFLAEINRRDSSFHYRLPTEAEWEYACRAGSTGSWSCGNDEESLKDIAWFWRTSGDVVLGGNWDVGRIRSNNPRTHPVGAKSPNAWGLYDMHGNVWEWCADWYGPYAAEAQRDPTGPYSGSRRVGRGGGCANAAANLRAAAATALSRATAPMPWVSVSAGPLTLSSLTLLPFAAMGGVVDRAPPARAKPGRGGARSTARVDRMELFLGVTCDRAHHHDSLRPGTRDFSRGGVESLLRGSPRAAQTAGVFLAPGACLVDGVVGSRGGRTGSIDSGRAECGPSRYFETVARVAHAGRGQGGSARLRGVDQPGA